MNLNQLAKQCQEQAKKSEFYKNDNRLSILSFKSSFSDYDFLPELKRYNSIREVKHGKKY